MVREKAWEQFQASFLLAPQGKEKEKKRGQPRKHPETVPRHNALWLLRIRWTA
jgi:hypothetical protein